MQRIALKVQNALDDIASFLERLRGLVTWGDPTASAFFLLVATVAALAVATVGLHVLLSFLLCWLVSITVPFDYSLIIIYALRLLWCKVQSGCDAQVGSLLLVGWTLLARVSIIWLRAI